MLRINKYIIFIFLLLFYSCSDYNRNRKNTQKITVQSDSIILKFIDFTGTPMRKGLVGIRFKDVEEQTSSILTNKKTILKVDSAGILKLNKIAVAKEYRVGLSDSLSAFYFLNPDVYQAFVLDLNKDSIIVKVVYF